MKARQNERIFITHPSIIHPSIHPLIYCHAMPCQVRIDCLDSITKIQFILPDDISSHLTSPHSSSPMKWSCCAIYITLTGALHCTALRIARDLLWSSLFFCMSSVRPSNLRVYVYHRVRSSKASSIEARSTNET